MLLVSCGRIEYELLHKEEQSDMECFHECMLEAVCLTKPGGVVKKGFVCSDPAQVCCEAGTETDDGTGSKTDTGKGTDVYADSDADTGTDTDTYSDWNSKLNITINAQDLGLGGDLTHYPLLVRLNTTNFPDIATSTNSGGTDIRFAKADGKLLSYEIEDWVDGTSGVVWVLVDAISSSTATEIKMYYDNSTASSMSDPTSVFDTANGFQGVWHLNEAAIDEQTASTHLDATRNGNHGAQMGNNRVAGVVSNGQHFDGDNDAINVGNDASLNITSKISMSAWIKMSSVPGGNGVYLVFSKDVPRWEYELYIERNSKILALCAFFRLLSGDYDVWDVGQNVDLPAAEWLHIAATFSGSATSLYVNGVLDVTHSRTGTIEDSAGVDLLIGGVPRAGTDEFFHGAIDEARITSTVLSSDWLKLDYETQRPGQTVVVF